MNKDPMELHRRFTALSLAVDEYIRISAGAEELHNKHAHEAGVYRALLGSAMIYAGDKEPAIMTFLQEVVDRMISDAKEVQG